MHQHRLARLHFLQARTWLAIVAGAFAAVVLPAIWLLRSNPTLAFSPHDTALIGDFENKTSDPRLADALATALTISLEQSHRANIFPRDRVDSTLQRIGEKATAPVTRTLGIQICQREGIHALISGTISNAGRTYEISSQLIDPKNGATIASYTERSDGEDRILGALDKIAKRLRAGLGESLFAIHQADQPLPEVTTSSMLALKEYASGKTLWYRGNYYGAIAHFDFAIAADPNFAMAHTAKGNAAYSYIINRPADGQKEFDKALSLLSRNRTRTARNSGPVCLCREPPRRRVFTQKFLAV